MLKNIASTAIGVSVIGVLALALHLIGLYVPTTLAGEYGASTVERGLSLLMIVLGMGVVVFCILWLCRDIGRAIIEILKKR